MNLIGAGLVRVGMSQRQSYPSDVRDEEWAFVAPYLTLLPVTAKQREHNLREVFNGLRWVVRTGSPWRYLPHDLPPWAAVYQQTKRWSKAGVWDRVFIAVSGDRDLEEVFFDSTAVRAHLHAAGAQKNTVHRRWAALAAVSAVKSIALQMPLATRSASRSPAPSKPTSRRRPPS